VSNFSSKEIEYLQSQRLGRMATVNDAGEPHVVPVTYRYNPEKDTIDIGGRDMGKTMKYRQAQRNGRIAFVVDDASGPEMARGIEIRGRAEALPDGGQTVVQSFSPELIRIYPKRIISWGLDGIAYSSTSRNVE
jgi:pyridoxamine 5'-phosphate oxidase family protein